jgi:hypothetical protein
MKIGRSIGIVVSILVVILIAAVIYIMTSLDSIVAGAIQKYGSQVTQTPVQVSSVNIDLKAGAASIDQISVGNPGGFSAPNIFTLGSISTALDVAGISKDLIVIEEILVKAPVVSYEINKAGASNIKELQKNIEQSTGGAGEAAAESGESSGPKVVIRKLVIESGKINAKVAALGDKSMSANLPRIQLNNIGEKSGGATGAEITRQVIDAIIAGVGPAVGNLGLDKYVGKSLDEAKALLDEKVGSEIGESLGDKAKEGAEGLKNLLGK